MKGYHGITRQSPFDIFCLFVFPPYVPPRCRYSKSSKSRKSPKCQSDPSTAIRLRLYDITVTATDSSGRQGQDICRVLLVPKCSKKRLEKNPVLIDITDASAIAEKRTKSVKYENDFCEKVYYKDEDLYFNGYYYKLNYLSKVANDSIVRHKIESSSKLTWDFNLLAPRERTMSMFDSMYYYEDWEEDDDIADQSGGNVTTIYEEQGSLPDDNESHDQTLNVSQSTKAVSGVPETCSHIQVAGSLLLINLILVFWW